MCTTGVSCVGLLSLGRAVGRAAECGDLSGANQKIASSRSTGQPIAAGVGTVGLA